MPRPKHTSEQIVWSEELREKIPDIPGVDIQTDGRLDPGKVACAMQKGDVKLRAGWNTQKLLGTAAWHAGWGSTDEEAYNMTSLSQWLVDAYGLYIVPQDLRMMVVVVEATWWFGDAVRKWIDSFPPTVQHEIARQSLKVLQRNPVHMDEDELEEARSVMNQIMKALPKGTPNALVTTRLQDADLLAKKAGTPIRPGSDRDEEEEIDIEKEILKQLRLSEDGMIGGMFMPRFIKGTARMERHLKEQIEAVQAMHEGITRDQALQMVIDAGIAALGLGEKKAA